MPNPIQKHRFSAFKKQNGCCYYCGALMWIDNPEKFAADHSISLKNAANLQCTAEHLVARCDGGEDTASNIVAACKHCNSTRHKNKSAPAPELYKKLIKKSLEKNKWHNAQILNSMFKKAPYQEGFRSASCPSA